MFQQESKQPCSCGNKAQWFLMDESIQKPLICGSCDFSKQYAATKRITVSEYMLRALQRPNIDPVILDSYEKVDSALASLIKELMELRQNHIDSHPELASNEALRQQLQNNDKEMTGHDLNKLLEASKESVKSEIINPALKEQLVALIEEISQLWKPIEQNPNRRIFNNTEVTAKLIKQLPNTTNELVFMECRSPSWAEVLQSANEQLKINKLSIERSNITDEILTQIAKQLVNYPYLNLSYNKIGKDGIAALAEAKPKTQKLILSNNLITDSDIENLAKIGCVSQLDLSDNKIGDEGATTIAISMPKLELLYLENNKITHRGAEQLIDKLKNIKQLHLSHNDIRQDFKQQMKPRLNVIL